MAKAYVEDESGNKVIIADSSDTIIIEGEHYFPPETINNSYLKESKSKSNCFWKGEASYKTIKVGKKEYQDAIWYYPNPLQGSAEKAGDDFTGYYAFWKGANIED